MGVDGLQSLQLVVLLLAIMCHCGPRCCPWIAQTPRWHVAAGTTAAPETKILNFDIDQMIYYLFGCLPFGAITKKPLPA